MEHQKAYLIVIKKTKEIVKEPLTDNQVLKRMEC